MPKIDVSIWNNGRNLRKRVKNLATMILTLAVINSYSLIANRNWIMLGLNAFYALTTIPIFLSWAKWQKQPPQEVEFENGKKQN